MSIQPTDNNLIPFNYISTTKNRVGSSTDGDSSETKDDQVGTSSSSVSGDSSLSLTDLNEQLDSADDVDWDKVSEIKNALAQGSLSIDLDALSQAIVEMHSS